MGKYEKLLIKILRGTGDRNIDFEDLKKLLKKIGFEERVKGSHHIFIKEEVEEILNLQSKSGKAKAYQVKQVRNVLVQNQLTLNENEG